MKSTLKLMTLSGSWNFLISKIVVIQAEAGTPLPRFILPGAGFHREGQPCKGPFAI